MRALYTSASFSLTFACLSAALTAVSGSMYSGSAGADGSECAASAGAALVSGFADSSGFVLASGFALSAVPCSPQAWHSPSALRSLQVLPRASQPPQALRIHSVSASTSALRSWSARQPRGNIRAQSPVGSLIVESFSPASTPPAKRTRISRQCHVGIRFLFFTVEVVLYSLSVLTFNFTPFCFRLTPSICIYLCL